MYTKHDNEKVLAYQENLQNNFFLSWGKDKNQKTVPFTRHT